MFKVFSLKAVPKNSSALTCRCGAVTSKTPCKCEHLKRQIVLSNPVSQTNNFAALRGEEVGYAQVSKDNITSVIRKSPDDNETDSPFSKKLKSVDSSQTEATNLSTNIEYITGVPFNWNLIGLLNWGNLYNKVITNFSEVYRLCFTMNLIPKEMNCVNCASPCKLQFRNTKPSFNKDSLSLKFVCPSCKRSANTSSTKSPAMGTVFEKSKITMGQVLGLAYWFVYGSGSCEEAIRECSFHNQLGWVTVSAYFNYFRQVCCKKVRDETYIGGPDCTVEVHEFDKTKYAKDEPNKKVIVTRIIIGKCRESGDMFVVENEDRSVKTLLRTIIQYVQPFSSVVVNCSKFFENLTAEEWETMTVGCNLKFREQKFVTDFQDTIGVWADLNRTVLTKNRLKLDSWLGMYMWKRKYSKMNLNLYKLILQHISEVQKYNIGFLKIES